MSDYRKDYLSKTLAAVILGLGIAFAGSALIAWGTPGGPAAPNKFQFVMWIVSPLWTLVLALVYLFRNGRRAWLVLGLANLVLFGVYLLIRFLHT